MAKFCQTSSTSLLISRYYLRYFPYLTVIYLIFITIFKMRTRPSNRIYETDYVASGKTEANSDERNGVVDCKLYNDVAADFLATQITKYY